MKRLLLLLAFLLPSLVFSSYFSSSSVSALSGSQFKAGRIIDDPVFFNGSAMSADQVQAFLNSKLPSCASGYTCLNKYSQSTPSRSAESGLCDSIGAHSSRSAANIINDVARACGVSQKSIIVLLQKEQGLVTDATPSSNQYKKATGYGCPDTAPCDSQYFGFFNQVYKAAWQFKKYVRDSDSYNFRADTYANIQYHPNTACKTKRVYIENNATAALYNYTPYTPNGASLNNLYGTGDSCSSYGNRNFWRYYNDWFGATIGTPFFRITNHDEVYMLGGNNDYYYIPSTTVLKAYGYGFNTDKVASAPRSYIDGKTFSGNLPVVSRFGGAAEIYLMDEGQRHHFTSQSILNNHGYYVNNEAKLPSTYINYFPDRDDMQNIVKKRGGDAIYSVESNEKRHITGWTAYTTLGSPTYSSRPDIELSNDYISHFAYGAPILTANQLLRGSDNNSYSFWNGSQRQAISAQTVSELGLQPNYTSASSAINQLASGGSTINKLVKDSSNNLYMLDSKKKYSIQSSDLTELGLSAGSFVTASDSLLGRVPSSSMSRAVRINGSEAIYLIHNGIMSHFYSQTAMSENGFSVSQAKSINNSSKALFAFTSRRVFPTGTLYRIGSSAAVYLVNTTSSSTHISSPSIFNEYRFSYNSVLSLVSSQAANYPVSGTLGYFGKDGSNNVWLIQADGSRHLASPTMLNSSHYNISAGSIRTLSNGILGKFKVRTALGDAVQPSGSNKVYKIVNGTKRWMTSSSALASQGYTRSDIVPLTASYISTIPTGANIN